VWGGVVLPEGTPIADLPAFDGFGRGFIAGVRREFVFQSPPSDAGTVGFEVEPTEQLAGSSTVGGGRLGREEFGQQGSDRSGPGGMMIAAGKTGGPGFGLPLSTGGQVLAVESIEAWAGQAQFTGGFQR